MQSTVPMPVDDPPERSTAALLAAARDLGASGGGAGAARLLALLYDPDAAADDVLSHLHQEPALAARVLKVANSPYYRISGRVGTVDRAVQMLGLTAIRGIAAAGCLDRMAAAGGGRAFNAATFSRHSLAVACAAQQLARVALPAQEGEAFMAGLLHDIGLLLMVKADAAAMARFTPPDVSDAQTALDVERRHFGTTHEDCAALLVQAWQLPPWLHAAVSQHHGEPACSAAPLAGLLRLADHCAHRAGFVLWPLCGLAPAPGASGSSAELVEAIVNDLPETMASLSPAQERRG